MMDVDASASLPLREHILSDNARGGNHCRACGDLQKTTTRIRDLVETHVLLL